MSDIASLVKHLQGFLPLSEEELDELAQRTHLRKIKRRQFLLQEGEICRHYTFVEQGCLKLYYIDVNGYEHNLQFAAENEWLADIGSFHTEKPSRLYMEAVEPSIVLQLEKKDLILFYTDYPKFNRIFRVMAEDSLVELQNRLLQNFSSTAAERYRSFLNKYPHLINRLPNTQIASYIGITPEFLSRIRKELSSK
ncbi:MAG TPA: Crp/Fnr family transcriptional regulator [Chitinophaga sp.]|uniref:Crp/Fnr family transcriptional regulator n=1 Tax=Chitinophaga sp. TaxID=1869181 RepID=UPI002B66D973|nr:Crp/Fnr family transcriptional regulator [Chitinophaga sp.]HVI47058.1 Crp/Fnr family transcriptional regulator [Chitinophaga sp.]